MDRSHSSAAVTTDCVVVDDHSRAVVRASGRPARKTLLDAYRATVISATEECELPSVATCCFLGRRDLRTPNARRVTSR
jgi:hypothetical protein